MKKILLSLILILIFSCSNVMANSHGGKGGVAGKANLACPSGGDSGDLYSKGGINGGGGRSISGQDSGGRSKHGGEGGEAGKTIN